jgi:hypothetical protein
MSSVCLFVYGVRFLEVCGYLIVCLSLSPPSLSFNIQLGQLPEFGSGRGLSGASLNHSSTGGGGFHDLDNALESLLEDNSETRGGGRQKAKATKTRGKDSTSKYVN